MRRFRIVPIVEGHGEAEAIPILIQRWLNFRRFKNFVVDVRAINSKGCSNLLAEYDESGHIGIEYFVKIALLGQPDAVLVILDSDGKCPKSLGQELLQRALVIAGHVPVSVVLAHQEFEAWFLAASNTKSFREHAIASNLFTSPVPKLTDFESIQNCKKRLELLMTVRYEPTVHQKQFTQFLPLTPSMSQRSRSFRKLLADLERLTAGARSRPGR